MPKPGNSRWAAHARPIITKVIRENPEADEKQLRQLISEQYPYGIREHHPYKQWLLEVRAQLNLRFRGKVTRDKPPKNLPPTPLFQP
ncbi:hypothetical protein IC235_11150 [Hymenobacter sp. BT664]|uniref:Uncharacterized protein n=1 Tax=Hymenobacter montanus TaxID=2771359 RepID=A0A927GJT5_9BACT|nr:hypothetical protein [Hymenobacter montanus]MBD2768446.1 hypothetical protein [Hymenobacter montanus]